ncbi:tRNA (5-methylaminomethyl-2-thiouridine)(34)-methyltransferase MnmD [Brevundimonas fluminis]|jgi:tRNA 5-methylaminomethyl-2-thiouridine biosynthesis bifunctional protein|uniref:tRNA (5-methylaminomethyl-2-thiouridine)(34)-methyltransferase MnmD n=1 Tax=Brevundimonas fluminis TaxID=2487274 RepID=UPI000F658ACA|nr:tRNA (5-methylaminomethyl-2-thiouridine)(34)-methyltransferase MnmD [Brevundimonas fluminis]
MTEDRSPRLDWTEDGAPVSGRFGDVYFSREDGLAESRAVFLSGCGLPDGWAGRDRFTVAELGFGTGLNVAALIDLWLRTRPAGGRLHVFSVEAFPLSREEAGRALSAWPELADVTAALIAAWPSGTPGFHRLLLPRDWGVTLDLAVAPVEGALMDWSGRADAWFLDGFAPAANPEMWSHAVLDLVAARSAPGAAAATFTVAGAVRRGLQDRGFTVDKRPGHGRKRERLEARAAGTIAPTSPKRRVAVVGGGVAGLATARALLELGAEPILIEAEAPGAGASGFPAALVTPRLDVGDRDIAALFAQSLARAGDLYDAVDGAVLARGVIQLEQTARDGARYDKVAVQDLWPAGAMTRLSADETARRLGGPRADGGLLMARAMVVRPPMVLEAWAAGVELARLRAIAVETQGRGVLIRSDDGATLEADAVVLSAGWGLDALAPELGLRPVRGQAEWIEGPGGPVAAWGGYVAPTVDGLLFGATHDRDRTDVGVDPADTKRNLDALAARLPHLAAQVGRTTIRHARAAIRATTPDRLPVAGALGDRVFVLGGLGSRGFALAPLLGEHVAALAVGAPSPLPARLATRVSPVRLAERRDRKDR